MNLSYAISAILRAFESITLVNRFIISNWQCQGLDCLDDTHPNTLAISIPDIKHLIRPNGSVYRRLVSVLADQDVAVR